MASQSVSAGEPPALKQIAKGPKLFRNWINPIIRTINWLRAEVRKNEPREGQNITCTKTPTGTKIDSTASGGGDMITWNVAANGLPAFADFVSTQPRDTAEGEVANPD